MKLDKAAGGEHGKPHHMQAVVSNVCPWCSSVFVSKASAVSHVRRAFRADRCIADAAVMGVVPEPPDSM
eukprot:2143944-Lingulodinium_polyedra.AAC.1